MTMGVVDVPGGGKAEQQDGAAKLQGDKLDGLKDKAGDAVDDQQERQGGGPDGSGGQDDGVVGGRQEPSGGGDN
jgi:hypothetical protein